MILFEEERSWWERIIHTDLLCWAVQWGWFARVNALCNLSRKKSREVAASLPGRSLSRRCFTLCITMEVKSNPELRGNTNATTVAVAKITGERGWRVQKQCLYVVVLADQKKASSRGKNAFWGILSTARATSYCLLPDTFWLRASKNAFKVDNVNFANSLSPLSIVTKVRTEIKSSQGT